RVARYEREGADHDQAHYFANVENLDFATGKILDALDELGYGDNTIVIFTSDNGPETLDRYRSANRSYGISGPLRGMKLHTHEAGYRVAGILRWPARVDPGQRSKEPVSSLDFLPTFAKLAGAEIPSDLELDGTNFLPALEGEEVKRKKPLLWVYYRSFTESGEYLPSVSMRDGDLKVRALLDGIESHSNLDESNREAILGAKLKDFEIYDLAKDPSESNPLPLEGSPLPDQLKRAYREAASDFHVWPTVGE
ncbi:MAG: sulfatase-like hydrolase/transferase, partial [Verrucomicrobiota bacterium]